MKISVSDIKNYRYIVRVLTIVLCISACASILYAAPAFINTNSSFTPTPKKDIARLTKEKLGQPPKLSKADLKKIKQGKIVVHKVGKATDSGQLFEAFGIVNASPKKLMSFMSDYPSRVGIMPHMEKVVANWNGNMAVVDITIKVAFSTLSYRLNVKHFGNYYIEWEYVHGDIKNTEGSYKFFPLAKGTKTLVVYQETSDPGVPLPQFILDMLTKNSIPDVIRAMRKGTARMK